MDLFPEGSFHVTGRNVCHLADLCWDELHLHVLRFNSEQPDSQQQWLFYCILIIMIPMIMSIIIVLILIFYPSCSSSSIFALFICLPLILLFFLLFLFILLIFLVLLLIILLFYHVYHFSFFLFFFFFFFSFTSTMIHFTVPLPCLLFSRIVHHHPMTRCPHQGNTGVQSNILLMKVQLPRNQHLGRNIDWKTSGFPFLCWFMHATLCPARISGLPFKSRRRQQTSMILPLHHWILGVEKCKY